MPFTSERRAQYVEDINWDLDRRFLEEDSKRFLGVLEALMARYRSLGSGQHQPFYQEKFEPSSFEDKINDLWSKLTNPEEFFEGRPLYSEYQAIIAERIRHKILELNPNFQDQQKNDSPVMVQFILTRVYEKSSPPNPRGADRWAHVRSSNF